MSQAQHPQIIIWNNLREKLRDYRVDFSAEHWQAMEGIIIAQPKSAVIKTPVVAIRVFFIFEVLLVIGFLVFYHGTPREPSAKTPPPPAFGKPVSRNEIFYMPVLPRVDRNTPLADTTAVVADTLSVIPSDSPAR